MRLPLAKRRRLDRLPALRLVCDRCGKKGVPMPPDFMQFGCQPAPCVLCGAAQAPLDDLRVGWDESD